MAAAAVPANASAVQWLEAYMSQADTKLVAPVFAAQGIATAADVRRLTDDDLKELELDGAVRMRLQQQLNAKSNGGGGGGGAGVVAPPGGPTAAPDNPIAAKPQPGVTGSNKPQKWTCVACSEPNPHGTKRCYACGATPDGAGGAAAATPPPQPASAAGGGGGLWNWLTGKKPAPVAPPPPAAVPVTMRALGAAGGGGAGVAVGGGGARRAFTSVDAIDTPQVATASGQPDVATPLTVAGSGPSPAAAAASAAAANDAALAALELRAQLMAQKVTVLKSTAVSVDSLKAPAPEPEVLMK